MVKRIQLVSGTVTLHILPLNFYCGSHIRFYSKKPKMIIYTADFTITGMQGNAISGTEGSPGSSSSDGFGLQGNGASNVSTVTATSTMGTTPSDPTTLTTEFPGHSHSGEAAAGRRFSAERGLVKYVHVLWPVLIGVALAL
jgi:hypothetical protein